MQAHLFWVQPLLNLGLFKYTHIHTHTHTHICTRTQHTPPPREAREPRSRGGGAWRPRRESGLRVEIYREMIAFGSCLFCDGPHGDNL